MDGLHIWSVVDRGFGPGRVKQKFTRVCQRLQNSHHECGRLWFRSLVGSNQRLQNCYLLLLHSLMCALLLH